MANEPYKVLLGVKLNTKDIRTQIKNYSTKTPLKIDVKLNTKGISSQIKAINSKTPVKVEVKLNTKNVQKQINNIRKQIRQLGNIRIDLGGTASGGSSRGGAQRAVNDMNWAYRQMLDISKKANSLSLKINGLDTSKNVNELKELSLQFARLKSDYETLKKLFGGQLSTTQWGNLQAELDETSAKLSAMDAKIKDTKANLARDIKGNFGNYDNQLLSLEGRFDRLAKKAPELKSEIERVRQALTALKSADGADNIRMSYENYLNVLKQVEAQITRVEIAERNQASSDKLTVAKQGALLKLKNMFGENSQAARRFAGEIDRIQKEINECGNLQGINHLNQQITNLGRQVQEANLKTHTFGQRFKKQWQQYTSYISVASIFTYALQGLRSMFEQVKLIDSAMTELKKVTDETNEVYNQFLTNAATRSREIGTTIDGLVSSTADFARLGYGFEDAQGLAEVANIYAVVGDEIEGVEGATESLISTMAAFKSEMNGLSNTEFAMSIIDKFNEIGNNFAISSGGIGEALERSASSLMAANNTIDESIALITAANTVVQNPDAVGTAFKTISMRIRGAKTELEEAGLETEGMVDSTAKLREEILALSGVDIMENANEFKSTYKIMDELAAKWENLTDIQQATVTELIAGKRQG